jgi:hypothetical protein
MPKLQNKIKYLEWITDRNIENVRQNLLICIKLRFALIVNTKNSYNVNFLSIFC